MIALSLFDRVGNAIGLWGSEQFGVVLEGSEVVCSYFNREKF